MDHLRERKVRWIRGGLNNRCKWFMIGPLCLILSKPEVKFWGYRKDYYDGPMYELGFWLFHFVWDPSWRHR